MTDNAARQPTGYLDKQDARPFFVFHDHRILLVGQRRFFLEGGKKFPLVVAHPGYRSSDRHTVDMNVPRGHENAHPFYPLVEKSPFINFRNVDHFSVSRRNHRTGGRRNRSPWVAKKIEREEAPRNSGAEDNRVDKPQRRRPENNGGNDG